MPDLTPAEREGITRDERHLRAVASQQPRETYAYVTEAAKRLLQREGKHLVIDTNLGDGLEFRLLDLRDDLGIEPGERDEWKQSAVEGEKELDQAEQRAERYAEALRELEGDYGCAVIEPPDPSEPPKGDPCREKRPTEPETWCYACIARSALTAPDDGD